MTPYIVLLELTSGDVMAYGTFNDRDKAMEFARKMKEEQPFTEAGPIVGWRLTLLWEPSEVPS